jgi:diguanylate cyclase (GGDEF)-like protein
MLGKRGKSAPIRFLSGLMFANMVYATSYLFEISASTQFEIVSFLYLEYVGICFIPVFWMLIAWSYHPGHMHGIRKIVRRLQVLYFFPLISILFIWTNFWHHLVYRSIDMERSLALPITLLAVERAGGFWVINGMIMLLFIIGSLRMIYNLLNASSAHRRHYLLLTLASLPPFGSYILGLTQSVPYNLDLSPIAFALSGLLIFWGIMNMQLFHMVPIAEHMVVDAMHDAMFILDTRGCLIECNIQARHLLGSEDFPIIGMPIQVLRPELSPVCNTMRSVSDVMITMSDRDEQRTYTARTSPVVDKRNRVKGHLILLHDVTDVRSYVEKLEHIASSDGLTDLLNHRSFMQLAQQEAERLREAGSGEFSLIMFDLDHFKAINDTHGHRAGDTVLQGIAELVRAHSGPRDLCARYGGEEFIMLLADTSPDRAVTCANSLREAIARTVFTVGEDAFTVTASFGVSSYAPGEDTPWEVALNRADTALYGAKAAGRNRVLSV